jgi:CheY-specific phosphatase CheX
MEKASLIQAMKLSISKVLEKMFFLPLDFDDSTDSMVLSELENNGALTVTLEFAGPFKGCLFMSMPKDLALHATANFLGKEEDRVSEDDVMGTVKEIINMIAGNTFSTYDDQAVFNLGAPEVIPEYEGMDDPDRPMDSMHISVNSLKDSRLTFSVRILECA